MKLLHVFIFICAFSISKGYAQEITGTWYGSANIGAVQLRIIFEIEKTEDGYKGTMQSPDQSNRKIPITSISYDAAVLTIRIPMIGFTYDGIVTEEGTIKGSFQQMGNTLELNLSKEEVARIRPQEPKPEFPYRIEEVTFTNEEAGIKLAGTLTLPAAEGQYPAVILITGSGPQNRDEELFGHKPFLVIADYLTRNGVIVLRYDERGVGESEGNYSTASIPEFSADALGAVNYLKSHKEVNAKRVGAIGHSEGGCVAFGLAAKAEVSYIINLAAPGVAGEELLNLQREAIFKTSGASDEFIAQYNSLMTQTQRLAIEISDKEELEKKVTELFSGSLFSSQVKETVKQLSSPGFKGLMMYNPAVDFKNITCPVLALNGGKDLQVPAKINLKAIEEGISSNGNTQVTTKEYPGLNHLFQTANSGLPVEYGQIEETFNPVVLKDILDWILLR